MRSATRRSIWLTCGALLIPLTPVVGQLTGGLDVGVAHPFVWRGITRSNLLNVQPAVWVAATGARGEISAGVWSSFEPWGVGADELAISGAGERRLTEIDYWLQYTARVYSVDVTLGGIHYDYDGGRDGVGGEPRESASELYLRFWPAPDLLPVNPSLTLFRDAGNRSHYVDLTLARSIPVFPLYPPIPFGDVLIRATTGLRIAPSELPADAGSGAPPVGDGFTHLDISAAVTARLNALSYVLVTAHHQWNFDPSTRRVSAMSKSARRSWIEAGVSMGLGFSSGE